MDQEQIEKHEDKKEEEFKPVGAMVFFVLLLLLLTGLWFFVYFITLTRI